MATGLVQILNTTKDFLETNFAFLNHGNCSIQNQSIFNELLYNEEAQYMGVIVGFGGTPVRNSQSSEFGGHLLQYRVVINIFALLYGNDEEIGTQIISAYTFFDNLIDLYKTNSTMGGNVMDFVFDRSEEPMIYPRSDQNEYLMLTTYWTATENL